jgi:hypothetical protein
MQLLLRALGGMSAVALAVAPDVRRRALAARAACGKEVGLAPPFC